MKMYPLQLYPLRSEGQKPTKGFRVVHNQDLWRFLHSSFYSQIKSKVGNILSKDTSPRIKLNIDGDPITSPTHSPTLPLDTTHKPLVSYPLSSPFWRPTDSNKLGLFWFSLSLSCVFIVHQKISTLGRNTSYSQTLWVPRGSQSYMVISPPKRKFYTKRVTSPWTRQKLATVCKWPGVLEVHTRPRQPDEDLGLFGSKTYGDTPVLTV